MSVQEVPLPISDAPPPVEDLQTALRPILTTGLPVRPEYDDETLLALRGVVARAIDHTNRLNRVKALDQLIKRQLAYLPDDQLREPALILFGMAIGSRGATLTDRRAGAADQARYDPDHFRKHIEPKILQLLAWQLHQDSQNYIPRSRAVPPPLEASGDTPTISAGDVSSKDIAEHEELLSRLWSAVYALRAEILKVERLKAWPYDPTEPATSEQVLATSIGDRDMAVWRARIILQQYLDLYGDRIEHGDAEFNAESLLRLAGWPSNEGVGILSETGI